MLHGMWDLPRPGLEPVSPALAGRFSTTAPPGKPKVFVLKELGQPVGTPTRETETRNGAKSRLVDEEHAVAVIYCLFPSLH